MGFVVKQKKEMTQPALKGIVSAFAVTTLESGGVFFFFCVASQFFLKHDMHQPYLKGDFTQITRKHIFSLPVRSGLFLKPFQNLKHKRKIVKN